MPEYKGYRSRVVVGQHTLTLQHERWPGRPRSEVHVAMASIVQVHVVAPTLLVNGWIQLDVDEPRQPLTARQVVNDPHSCLFTHQQRKSLAELSRLVIAAVSPGSGDQA